LIDLGHHRVEQDQRRALLNQPNQSNIAPKIASGRLEPVIGRTVLSGKKRSLRAPITITPASAT
jgi:hypothetical protein